MTLRSITSAGQHGLSLVGFMFVVVIIGILAVLGMKVVPSVVEYSTIKKAIVKAKEAGTTPAEITSFKIPLNGSPTTAAARIAIAGTASSAGTLRVNISAAKTTKMAIKINPVII